MGKCVCIPHKWFMTVKIVLFSAIVWMTAFFCSPLAIAACIDNPTDATQLNGGSYTGPQMFSITPDFGESIKVKAYSDTIYMILYGPLFDDRVCELRRGSNIEGPGTKTLTYTFTFGQVWYLEVYGGGTVTEYQLDETRMKEEKPREN